MRRDAIDLAARLGLHLTSWNPGDNLSIRIFRTPTEFHAGRGIFTGSTWREVYAFLCGWQECLDSQEARA